MARWGILGVLTLIGVLALLWGGDVFPSCSEAAEEQLGGGGEAQAVGDDCRARCQLSRDACLGEVRDGRLGRCDKDAKICALACEEGADVPRVEETRPGCVERCRMVGRTCMAAADSEERYDGCQVRERVCRTGCPGDGGP